MPLALRITMTLSRAGRGGGRVAKNDAASITVVKRYVISSEGEADALALAALQSATSDEIAARIERAHARGTRVGGTPPSTRAGLRSRAPRAALPRRRA
jgi:hypothetical protein